MGVIVIKYCKEKLAAIKKEAMRKIRKEQKGGGCGCGGKR